MKKRLAWSKALSVLERSEAARIVGFVGLLLVNFVGVWTLVPTVAASSGLAAAGGVRLRIPELHGTALTGDAVNLPEGLQGKVGVLVVGFSQGSRDAVTGWGRRLAADYRESPAVVYYEMPMLAGVPKLLRGVVTGRIKASVPERARARFVPITGDEKAWRAVTHYDRADDPYVLIVDGQGQVVWQTQGLPTDAAYADVKARVEGLQGR